MKNICQQLNWFLHQKIYVVLLSLTALCCYGFEITHYSIGVDDTATELYANDGLYVVMGRWVLYLVNKIFPIGKFAPFMPELVGVLLLMTGVTLFCVLFRRLLGGKVGIVGYTVFACVFVSNPIITEAYFYYFHCGMDLGYILAALSLISFLDGLDRTGKNKFFSFAGSFFYAFAATGCYESFLILYIVGVLTILFLRGMTEKDKLCLSYITKNMAFTAIAAILCVILRMVVAGALTYIFDLYDAQLIGPKSITELFTLLMEPGGVSTLVMLLKRYILVYYINALVYLPVTVFVASSAILGISSLFLAWKRKNIWYPVLFAGMQITMALLTVVGADLTKYRSCQTLPFFSALGIFFFYYICIRHKWKKILESVFCLATFVLVYNQASCMNFYFYKEYLKYENARDTMLSVAHDIELQYGKEVPVLFTGRYYTPYEFMDDFFVDYDSWQYRTIAMLAAPLDEHLTEKYYSEYGYRFDGEASVSVIDWGFRAFDGTNRELVQFLRMHGYNFTLVKDKEVLREAMEYAVSMPCWPQNGSIVEWNGYVLVHMDR